MSSKMTPIDKPFPDTAERFLSMTEIAERYGVALQTVRHWRVNGYGPRGFRVGRLVRYPLSECIRWEQERQAEEAA